MLISFVNLFLHNIQSPLPQVLMSKKWYVFKDGNLLPQQDAAGIGVPPWLLAVRPTLGEGL